MDGIQETGASFNYVGNNVEWLGSFLKEYKIIPFKKTIIKKVSADYI